MERTQNRRPSRRRLSRSGLTLASLLAMAAATLTGCASGKATGDDAGQATASAEKPPKTTEWAAPMRAQASMVIAASGIIGR
ncbi:hypothetical protein ACFV23_46355 [Streptomyces sp. NPDC059627]